MVVDQKLRREAWGQGLSGMSWEDRGGGARQLPLVPPGLVQNVLECCEGSRRGELKEAFLHLDQEVCSFLPGFGSDGPG